jgi:hypothetical protein
MISGVLFEVRPGLPLLISIGLAALLIPVLLISQKRMGRMVSRTGDEGALVSPVGSNVEVLPD